MIKNFGVMQGRLLRPIKNKIQSFPEKNWNKEFKIIKGLNLKFLEWTLDDKNLEKNPLLLHKGQNYIKRLCKKNNITINSITGDCFMQKPFWKKKGKQKKVLILKLKKIISSASRLKIKFIIIPLVDKGSIQSNLQKKTIIKDLCNLETLLKKKKLQILFETDFSPEMNLEFIKNFNSKLFGINYDIGNSAGLNYDPVLEFKLIAKYIKNIHIKDRLKFGKTVPLGKGNANFDLISKLCKQYNYKGKYILQCARKKNGDEKKTIKEYLKFLKKYF